jgi:hypothetical protein
MSVYDPSLQPNLARGAVISTAVAVASRPDRAIGAAALTVGVVCAFHAGLVFVQSCPQERHQLIHAPQCRTDPEDQLASTPQDFTSGQVLTAVQMDKLPQGILDFQSSTSNSSATSAGSELTLLTASALTPAQSSRRWKLRFHARGTQATVSADTFVFRFKESGTVLNEYHYITATGGSSTIDGVDWEHVLTPSVAAHTYSVVVARATGTGTLTTLGAATAPMFFYVEDVGSA